MMLRLDSRILIAVTAGLFVMQPGFAENAASVSSLSEADLLKYARSVSQAGPTYRYGLSMLIDEVDARLSIDPTAPSGQRVTVLEPVAETRSKDFQKSIAQIDSDAEGDIWCHDLLDQVPESVAVLAKDEQSITYGFTPQADEAADKTESKMLKNMNATLTLNRQNARVESFAMTLSKPFKPVIVAKIKKFEMRIQCSPSPDGRHFINEFFVNIQGRAMMKSFAETQTRSITSMERIVEPAGLPATTSDQASTDH